MFGGHAHHRLVERAVHREIVGQRGDDARRLGLLGRIDGETEFLEAGLGFDDERVGPGFHERGSLLLQRRARLGLGEFAVGFKQRAKRADVAQHVAGTSAEGLARDAHGGGVDLRQFGLVAMTAQHEAAAAKGVGDDAIGPRIGVAALDGEHAVGMREIPRFAAGARFKAGEEKLRAHGAVAHEAAGREGFKERGLVHGHEGSLATDSTDITDENDGMSAPVILSEAKDPAAQPMACILLDSSLRSE